MVRSPKRRALPSTPNIFHAVVESGDVSRVRELLTAGNKPDEISTELAVDLCIKASATGQIKEERLFGKMPSKKEREKAAADAEVYYEIAELLLEGGATVPELLCPAARCGHTKLALLLIRSGADVDYDPPMGTPLENAISAGNVEVVRALIKAGADIHHQGIDGTLLTRAVDASEIQVAKQLIAAGLDVNVIPRFGAGALLTAVTKGEIELVRLLLEAGANVNQKGSIVCGECGKPEVTQDGSICTTHIPEPPVARGATPLIVATRRGYGDIAAQLIASGADVHPGDAEGLTALAYALKANNKQLIKLLKGAGARPPKYREGSLKTAFVAAAKAGDCARLRELIDAGVDLNVKCVDEGDDDISGTATALKYAAEKGHLDAVKLLLASGATVDERFGSVFAGDETALMHAARAGHWEVADALIAKGAAVAAKDRDGKTALHYAAAAGQTRVIQFLIKHGANVETKTKDGSSPLMEAAASGHAEAITALIKAGADPNRFTHGLAALYYAASSGHVAAVQALLDAGADPKAGDNRFSPLEMASSEGHADVVDLLLGHGKGGKGPHKKN